MPWLVMSIESVLIGETERSIRTTVLISTWGIAIFKISLVPSDRVLMRGNLVASQIDKAGGYDFKEVYRSVD